MNEEEKHRSNGFFSFTQNTMTHRYGLFTPLSRSLPHPPHPHRYPPSLIPPLLIIILFFLLILLILLYDYNLILHAFFFLFFYFRIFISSSSFSSPLLFLLYLLLQFKTQSKPKLHAHDYRNTFVC